MIYRKHIFTFLSFKIRTSDFKHFVDNFIFCLYKWWTDFFIHGLQNKPTIIPKKCVPQNQSEFTQCSEFPSKNAGRTSILAKFIEYLFTQKHFSGTNHITPPPWRERRMPNLPKKKSKQSTARNVHQLRKNMKNVKNWPPLPLIWPNSLAKVWTKLLHFFYKDSVLSRPKFWSIMVQKVL